TDGTSSTLAVGERASLFVKAPWAGVMMGGTVRTTPGAPVYTAMVHPAEPMAMARVGNKPFNSPDSEPYDFFSPHTRAVQFVFADGSVRRLASSDNAEVMKALGTRAGDETLSAGQY